MLQMMLKSHEKSFHDWPKPTNDHQRAHHNLPRGPFLIVALSLQHRWWGILGIALQKAVAHIVHHSNTNPDLVTTLLEPGVAISDLHATDLSILA